MRNFDRGVVLIFIKLSFSDKSKARAVIKAKKMLRDY
jgi:hypothetical protein